MEGKIWDWLAIFFLYNEGGGNNLKRRENLLLGYREYEVVHVNTTIKFLIPGVAKTKCNIECQKLYENKLSQNLQRSNTAFLKTFFLILLSI